jgi:hypothetical protein
MVQLQIKNLHNDTFSVECDENDTVDFVFGINN